MEIRVEEGIDLLILLHPGLLLKLLPMHLPTRNIWYIRFKNQEFHGSIYSPSLNIHFLLTFVWKPQSLILFRFFNESMLLRVRRKQKKNLGRRKVSFKQRLMKWTSKLAKCRRKKNLKQIVIRLFVTLCESRYLGI